MMKLNEKGLGKLYNSKACYYDDETEEEVVALSYFEHVFEFEADDFEPEPKKEPTVEQKPKEPEIRLSVEEAKGICSIIACFIMGKPRNLEDYKGFESMNRQILQIEQVEKKDESN